jgi:predicted transcriptional regulator
MVPMRPRVSESTERRIERLLAESPHENKSRFVEFAIQRYIDDLERRQARR